jgi:hypothetical protein
MSLLRPRIRDFPFWAPHHIGTSSANVESTIRNDNSGPIRDPSTFAVGGHSPFNDYGRGYLSSKTRVS